MSAFENDLLILLLFGFMAVVVSLGWIAIRVGHMQRSLMLALTELNVAVYDTASQ